MKNAGCLKMSGESSVSSVSLHCCWVLTAPGSKGSIPSHTPAVAAACNPTLVTLQIEGTWHLGWQAARTLW